MQRSSTGASTWTSTAATGTGGSTGSAPQLLSNSLTRTSSSGGNSNANINISNSTSHAQPSSSPSGAPSSPVLLANNNVSLNTSSNLSSGLAAAAPSVSTSIRLVPSASTSTGGSALSDNASELQSVTDSNTARVAPQKNGVVQLAHRQGQQQQVSSTKDNNSKSASAMNFYGIPGNQDASSSMKKQYLPPSSQQTSEYLSQSHSQSKAGSSSTSSATNALTALSGDSDAVPGPSSAGRETAGTAGGGKESTSAKSKSGNGSSKRKKTETTSNNDYDNRKKKSKSKGKPNSADASAGNVSDAPAAAPPSIVLFPARRQSAAPAPSSTSMARDNSNTSVASTRSLPARMTRGSKRKYVEETTESSDEDDEDRQASLTEGEHTPLKVGPASLALSQSSRKDKGKERAISVAATNEDGLSTAPPSRSTSPEGDNSRTRRRLSASEAQGLAASGTPSGLSVRLRKTTSQQSANTTTSTKGRKRKKNRITGSIDPSAQSSSKEGTALTIKTRKGSRESQEPPSTRREKTPLQVDQIKDEAASTSDSSVSTPLASAFQTGVTADGVEAKIEPVSESEDGRLIGSGKRRGSSAIPMQENRRRNKTKQEASSRPTSEEAEDQNDVKDDISESRNLTTAPSSRAASTSTEPTEDQQLLNLPYSDTRSVSAMDGGDEMSVADGSTAMPSPAAQEPDEQTAMNAAAELPENNDNAASTTSTAPVVAPKKRRGRPPKKRPLSQTPAPDDGTGTSATASGVSPASASAPAESETPTIKTRYRATLDRERQCIEDGTHPLLLEALVEYDKLRQDKITLLRTLLDSKEETWTKWLEAREKSLWETWQDERRKLWYEMTMSYSRKQRQLVFEKDTMEAEAIDPSGLYGTAKTILWPDRDPSYVSAKPPVVEPLIRVKAPQKQPPKGKGVTRSQKALMRREGEAVITPLNLKAAQGISSLTNDEISLDLEIMGLSSRKLSENWFYNAKDETPPLEEQEVNVEQVDDEIEYTGAKQGKIKQDRKPVAREISDEDEFLLPKVDPAAHLGGNYSYNAPYDYAWPPYDSRFPPGPPYNSYYAAAPHYPPRAGASSSSFSFPTGATKDDHVRSDQNVFSFPQGGRPSRDGREGHSKADAILIDDDRPPANGAEDSEAAPSPSKQKLKRKGTVEEPRKSTAHDEYARTHRYPPNAYPAEYARDAMAEAWTAAEHRYRSPIMHGSPNGAASSPQQRDGHAFRERRTSSGEYDSRYRYTPPEDSRHWVQPSSSSRYRPYYDTMRALDEAAIQHGYPGELYVDPWGRPVDAYGAPAYFHPGYAEAMVDPRYRSPGELPPPAHADRYHRDDPRSHYRQYSAQSDEQYYSNYPYPSYSHQATSSDPRYHHETGVYASSSHRASKRADSERHAPDGAHSSTYSPQRR